MTLKTFEWYVSLMNATHTTAKGATMDAKITARIAAELTDGRTVQDATRVAAFKANAEAAAKGWSVKARAALVEDFAQAGVSLLLAAAA